MRLKSVLNNPLKIWLKHLLNKIQTERKNKGKHLNIGYLTYINSNCKFGIYNSIWDYVNLVDVEIGDYSYIGHHCFLTNVKIGKFSCIAEGVTIGLGNHPTKEFISIHPAFYSKRFGKEFTFSDEYYFNENYEQVIIGNDVWIGYKSIIMSGIKIGHGAIIAAGSIVTKDVLPYSIVAGVPCKEIKTRFSKSQIDEILESEWWDYDEEYLKQNFRYFHKFTDFKTLISKNK